MNLFVIKVYYIILLSICKFLFISLGGIGNNVSNDGGCCVVDDGCSGSASDRCNIVGNDYGGVNNGNGDIDGGGGDNNASDDGDVGGDNGGNDDILFGMRALKDILLIILIEELVLLNRIQDNLKKKLLNCLFL